jgi:ornithine decarboxylase
MAVYDLLSMSLANPRNMVIPAKSATAENKGVENLIRKMIKTHKTPLMLIRKDVLKKQFQTFKKLMPRVDIFYAMKANPHPEIIKTFVKLGANFDVASANEMKLALECGASPRQIVFANTIKSSEDIQMAKRNRVNLMTFDNEAELYKIAKYHPGAKLLLRIKVANVGSIVELSLKFGAIPEHSVHLLKKAKNLGLVPLGIAFHVGSQCTNVESYVNALEVTASIFQDAAQKGINLSVVDIGGGFPIKYFEKESHIEFEYIARTINKEIKRLFHKDVQFMAEPGRFMVGPAGILITQVVGRAFRDNKYYYYLNDGIYGDFSGIVFDQCKYEFKTLKRGQKYLSTLAGPTCDSFDTISVSEELPELDVGNVVYVKVIGAYSSCSAVAGFNGFAPAKILMV